MGIDLGTADVVRDGVVLEYGGAIGIVKMADTVRSHCASYDVPAIHLTGGTCCFPGIQELFRREFPGTEIFHPSEPLYLTPLAKASYGL